MRLANRWRPRTTPRWFGVRAHHSPPTRAVRCLLFACCLPLGTLGGMALLAGPAQAAPSAWSVTPTPSPHAGDTLDSVSCTGPSFCMAVGSFDGGAGTLAETWNGKAWAITPSRNRGAESVLSGVSCTGSVSCEAVGSDDNSSGTLVERWNGKAWSVTPSPSGGIDGILQGVACPTAASCVAVGTHEGTFGLLTLVESWNGSRWSVVSSPSPGSEGNNALSSVSCSVATRCDAVGYFTKSFGPTRTLAESWNGSRWSVVSTPNRTSSPNLLDGVSCVSSSDCVAAGYDTTGSGFGQTLIESWNGSHWSITPSPHPGADQQLLGVTCTSATRCEALGYHGSGPLVSDKTLVETGS